MQSLTRPKEPKQPSLQNSFLALYLLYAAAATLFYAAGMARHFNLLHDWAVEDWLLNYSGGFVRRGLPGSIALALGDGLHLAPAWLATAAQAACYLLTLLSAWLLLRRAPEHSPWTWALILSPATFTFQLLDHVGGFRKEILFFAGLSLLLLVLRRRVKRLAVAIFLSFWLPFLVLSHESTFFYLGYYAAAVLVYERQSAPSGFLGRGARVLAAPLLLSVLAMAAVSLHPGNRAIASAVCRSVEHTSLNRCGDGIQYLGYTPGEARADAEASFHKYDYPLIYSILGALAIAPIVVILRAGLHHAATRGEAMLLIAATVVTVLVSLPLYLFAVDWGRWIYMDVLPLTLLLFALDWDHRGAPLPARYVLRQGARTAIPFVVALLLYATLWSLPHLPIFGQFYGYAQRVDRSKVFQKYVLHHDPAGLHSA